MFGKQFEEKYFYLKVLKVHADTYKKVCTIFFIYPESKKDITDEERNEVLEFVSDYLKLNMRIVVNFKKSYLDDELIFNELFNFVKNKYPAVYSLYKQSDVEIIKENNKFIDINQKMSQSLVDTIDIDQYCNEAKLYLEKNFCAEFNFNVIEKPNENLDSYIKSVDTIKPTNINKVKRYEVFNVKNLIGEDVANHPEYIANLKGEKDNVILAGKIMFLELKEYVKKKYKDKPDAPKNSYIKFTLNDYSGTISCIHFSTKSNEKKLLELKDGLEILVKGNVTTFNNKLEFSVKCLHVCSLKKKEIIKSSTTKKEEDKTGLEEPNTQELTPVENSSIMDQTYLTGLYRNDEIVEYKNIKPEKYVNNIQSNLFVDNFKVKPIFTQKSFVVFDLETTGLTFNSDEIIEIGAVKVVNGVITETFETLIKPKRPIPQSATDVNNITNDMVKNSPNLEDVLDDFFLFCKGSVLVAYNISFDYSFINFYGKNLGLLFDNERVDALQVAKDKLFLKNYKLATVVKYLNIELIGAHRAINDTIATAKAFIQLYE